MPGVLYDKGRCGHRDAERRSHVKTEAGSGRYVSEPSNARGDRQQQKLGGRQGALSPRTSEGAPPCQHLDVRPVASGL